MRSLKATSSLSPTVGGVRHHRPCSAIIIAARTYALNPPSRMGLGIEQNHNSLQTVRAIAILRAITGNIDVPGGDI